MTREELIEEAARALFQDGDGLDATPGTRAIWVPRIEAALAVFERAYQVSARDLYMASLPDEGEA